MSKTAAQMIDEMRPGASYSVPFESQVDAANAAHFWAREFGVTGSFHFFDNCYTPAGRPDRLYLQVKGAMVIVGKLLEVGR